MSYYLRSLGGRPELWAGDMLVFKQLQPLLLLSYLERCRGVAQSRLAVANLFWPNLDKEKRLSRLSEVLRVLELEVPAAVNRNADEVTLGRVNSDAKDLCSAIEDEDYELAAALYRGHFLENVEFNRRLKLAEAPALYDWLLGEREALLDVARDGYLRHAELMGARDKFAAAAELALIAFKLRTEQSLLSPAHYARIHTLLLAQDAAQAAQVAGEAHRLFDPVDLGLAAHPTAARASLRVPGNVPQTPTRLFGREAELAECNTLLRGETRLLVVTGPPGVGKTRFALELGRHLKGYRKFKEGVHVSLLETYQHEREWLQELARVLNIDLGQKNQQAALAAGIAERPLLLVLDNFEDLLRSTPVLNGLLESCPQLSLLVTSRTHLVSDWARHYELGGLASPPRYRTLEVEEALEYPAVALFTDWAKQSMGGFELNHAALPQVQTLMAALGGLPLALKLAAGWLESVDLGTLVDEIQTDLAFLTAPESPSLSIVAAVDASYERLDAEDRVAFSHLAVLVDPFTHEAAKEVAGVNLAQLRVLQRRSLLHWDEVAARYSFHPLLRQYAQQKLAETGVKEALEQRHAHYYLSKLQEVMESSPAERDALYRVLESELRDLERAWRWALAAEQYAQLEQVAYPLCMVCHRAAYLAEGLAMIEAALEPFGGKSPMLLATKGWFLQLLGHYEASLEPAREGLELIADNDDARAKQLCLETLGASCGLLGRYSESATYFEQVLNIVSAEGADAATAHMNLGISQTAAGLYKDARDNLEKAHELFTLVKASQKAVSTEFHIGKLLIAQNHIEEAANLLRKTLKQADSLAMSYWLPRVRLALAEADLQIGQQEEARQLGEEALKEAQLSRRRLLEAEAKLLLARCLSGSQESNEINNHMKVALRTFSEYTDLRRLLKGLLVTVNLLQVQNNHSAAKKVFSVLLAFKDSLTAAQKDSVDTFELEPSKLSYGRIKPGDDLVQTIRRTLIGTPFEL